MIAALSIIAVIAVVACAVQLRFSMWLAREDKRLRNRLWALSDRFNHQPQE